MSVFLGDVWRKYPVMIEKEGNIIHMSFTSERQNIRLTENENLMLEKVSKAITEVQLASYETEVSPLWHGGQHSDIIYLSVKKWGYSDALANTASVAADDPVVPYETTGHLRSHPGVPACMQSGARLSLGYRHDCPRPSRGGGGARSAGGVGLMTGTDLYALETGEGKTPRRQPHPHGDSHHGPQHEDMLARKGRTRGQAGSGTNLVRDERQPEEGGLYQSLITEIFGRIHRDRLSVLCWSTTDDPDTWPPVYPPSGYGQYDDYVRMICHSWDHYYNPSLGTGWAPLRCGEFSGSAKDKIDQYNWDGGMRDLGWSSHFMTDVGNPLHTGKEAEQIIFPWVHFAYEDYVGNNWLTGYQFKNIVENNWVYHAVYSPDLTTRLLAGFSKNYEDTVYWTIFYYPDSFSSNQNLRAATEACLLSTAQDTLGLVKYVTD